MAPHAIFLDVRSRCIFVVVVLMSVFQLSTQEGRAYINACLDEKIL